MPDKKWLAPILPYLAVWAGLFFFKSAWITLIGFHISILLALVFLHPHLSIRLLLKSKHPKWILFSVLFCSTSGIGLFLLWDVFGISPDLPAQLQSIGLNSSTWSGFIVYFSFVNPFLEEYFWRGILGNDSTKLFIGDLVFAGYHVLVLWGRVHPLSILFAVTILISAGWLWRQISRLDEGLLAAVLGHATADFLILTVIYRMCI
jgi:membrane protease YdiL (CAAX protease family)